MNDQRKMSADKIIIIDSTAAIALFVIALIANLKGDYLERAYMALFLMGLFFLVALTITVVNLFLLKNATTQWIKFLAFAPIVLSVGHLCFVAFELGSPREPGIEKQIHTLTVEIRTPKKLKNAEASFNSANRGKTLMMGCPNTCPRKEGDLYIYEIQLWVYYESDRTLFLHSKKSVNDQYVWETRKVDFNIGYKPKVFPFTEWQRIYDLRKSEEGPVDVKIRYMVEKGRHRKEVLPYYIEVE
jgi:hypothetical protein